MSRQIDARIVNTDDMAGMFGDLNRLRNNDFAFKWHRFPTTKEEIQATLKEIGVDGIAHTGFAADNFDTVIYAVQPLRLLQKIFITLLHLP